MTARVMSEGELIQTYLAPLARRTPGALGLRDDCALLVPPPGSDLVVTTDAVAAGVHFFEDDAASDIAWKALAVNVSDLAAKGAEPFAYQMALSFPQAPTHDWLSAFAGGLEAAQSAFGIGLLGGDTDRRPGPLTITITAFGHTPKGTMVLRSGARPGDIIFVSGTLGDSALGLKQRVEPEAARKWQLSASETAHLTLRYLKPEPRLTLRDALRAHAASAMDISDGLVKDLERLCAASCVKAHVRLGQVPLSQAARAVVAADAGTYGLIVSGGDDYEILCTVPPDQAEAFGSAARACAVSVSAIGTISPGSGLVLEGLDGLSIQLTRSGWDHF